MRLKGICETKDGLYADFEGLKEGIGIEANNETNKVTELHFSIMIELDKVLEPENYKSNEEKAYFYDINKGILRVPLIKK